MVYWRRGDWDRPACRPTEQMTSKNNAKRRLLGFGLMMLSALILIGVLAWRLLGFGNSAPTDTVTARFTTTPAGAPV